MATGFLVSRAAGLQSRFFLEAGLQSRGEQERLFRKGMILSGVGCNVSVRAGVNVLLLLLLLRLPLRGCTAAIKGDRPKSGVWPGSDRMDPFRGDGSVFNTASMGGAVTVAVRASVALLPGRAGVGLVASESEDSSVRSTPVNSSF